MFRKSFVFCVGLAILVALSLSGCGGGSKPVSVAVTASATTVDATNSVTLTAVVSNDKNAAGVSWNVSGGGTLSNTTTTSATYTAPSTNSASLSVTVTATSIADTTKAGSATLTVPATPTITTTALAAGTVGTAYSATLAGSGGITPYIWSVNTGSALPACLSMTTAGVISGTPVASCAGTSSITFKLTDSGTATPLTITKALSLTLNAAPAITFTSATMPAATYNVAYAGSAAATGGAGTLTYSLSSGSLPTGLSLNASTGAITGTPAVVGTYPITVRAADAYGDSATQTYSIVSSYAALTVATTTLPNGYVGSAYSKTLLATGGSLTGYVWSVASGSTLPAGLTLSAAGVLSGTPTTTGTPSFTVSVTDSVSNPAGTATLSMTIKPAVSVTTSTPLPTGYVGSAYSKTLAATGGADAPYTWTVTSGSTLPAGLSLSTTGVLSGTPTATGTPSFSVTATDSVGNTGSATLGLTISPGITISTGATLPGGYQGTTYPGATLAASGGTNTGFTWAVASGSTLPAGLSLSAGGAISGTPTGSGTTSVAITVTDSVSNTATKTFSITIEATLTVSSPSTLRSGTINVAYSNQLTATGGSGTYSTWIVTSGGGTLTPLNLSLSTTGVLSGTPTITGTATFTAQVTDSESHTATATLSVSVYNALTITTTSLPAGYVGTAYNQTLGAGGGSGSGYTWTTTASNLSTFGLTLSAAGVITGTPTQAGTATLTAKVTDSSSNSTTQALSFTIYAALTLSTPSSTLPGPAIRGEAYDGQILASGGSGTYSFVTTVLPTDGLSANISGAVLHVTGTPTTAQTVTFTVTLTDTLTSVSVGPITYSIVVSEPATLTLPAPNPSSLPSATINQSYTGAINATGGASPYTWTVNGTPGVGPVSLGNGTLAASNSSGNTLSISGTPSSTGTVSFTAAIKDNLNTTVSNTYTIAVNAAGSQVSGNIYLNNGCGSPTLPTVTVSINTSPVQTVTTDSNGNYSFASVPNGSYTITPSISGPTSAFYPATQSITVSNATVNVPYFNAVLGYTVSGTVSYTGLKTGRVYVELINSCNSSNGPGTSLSAAGTYTIRGVPPGTYTLNSWMDTLGFGYANANNPSGSTSSVSLTNANVSGANVTLSDPSAVTLSTASTIQGAIGYNLGAVLGFKAIKNSNGVELPTSYTVQWSTDSFTSVTGYKTFAATGANGKNVWIINGLTNGTTYSFRARGATATSTSNWSAVVSATVAAPTSGNTVSGTVTFTGTATGPLAVGFRDQSTGTMYLTAIASPVSPQAYSVKVPTGSNYFFFGIIDQNNDGLIDAGDITNTDDNSSSAVSISADATMNLTLPSAGSTAKVTTQHWQSGSNSGYSLNFETREANKLPVAATIVSGPNVSYPLDLGACTDCGTPQFYTNFGINTVRPTTSDSYGILVTYGDGTSETLTATVSAVLDAFPTNLAPTTGTSTSTSPTFTWTDPSSASSYVYQLTIWDNATGSKIWQVPSDNSNLNGLPYTTTSITWPTDPTDSSNTPILANLSTSTTYNWQVQAQDSYGNQAQTQVNYKP